MPDPSTMNPVPISGTVQDAGGKTITILVDDNTMNYPTVGERVEVFPYDLLPAIPYG